MPVKFEQNRIGQTTQNFLTENEKMVSHFDKLLTPFWKTFLWLKQFFDAKLLIKRLSSFSVPKTSKHSPTCVTRLKVAPNMADPISLNEEVVALKPSTDHWVIPEIRCTSPQKAQNSQKFNQQLTFGKKKKLSSFWLQW